MDETVLQVTSIASTGKKQYIQVHTIHRQILYTLHVSVNAVAVRRSTITGPLRRKCVSLIYTWTEYELNNGALTLYTTTTTATYLYAQFTAEISILEVCLVYRVKWYQKGARDNHPR